MTRHLSLVAKLSGIAGILILVATGVAAGQMPRDPREHARSHVGPFYVTPTLTLEELGVDTNVFNQPDPTADVTSTLVPHADVWVPFGRRALLTASSTVPLIYYQTFESERSVNPEVRLRGDVRTGRVSWFASAVYANSRRRPNLEIDARARHTDRSVDVGVETRLAGRLSLDLGASEAHLAFDEGAVFNDTSLRDTLNRRVRSGWSSIRYDVTPLTRVQVRGQFNEERFPYSPVRDAESLSIMPGVEFQPRALISGSASVGVRRFQPTSGRLPDFTGVVVNTNLSYAFRGATRLRLTALRDLAYSYSEAEPYYAITSYGLGVSRHVGGRVDVTAGGEWQTHRYRRVTTPAPLDPLPSATDPASPVDPSVNTIQTWSAGLGYRLWRTQRLGFGATYRKRDSSLEPERTYSGLRLMVTVGAEL
jgi:hypothetical protein